GKKIKLLRKQKGLTASELGEQMGVSQQQISRYERGVNHINIETLEKLSFFFKVSIFEFIINNNYLNFK
ncbi:helix-turn-helix transcriptional regulator, partial [Providencia rettgeri]|nr:helix-turn-helix transcriptional regulator [Providencia rettgeri]